MCVECDETDIQVLYSCVISHRTHVRCSVQADRFSKRGQGPGPVTSTYYPPKFFISFFCEALHLCELEIILLKSSIHVSPTHASSPLADTVQSRFPASVFRRRRKHLHAKSPTRARPQCETHRIQVPEARPNIQLSLKKKSLIVGYFTAMYRVV